MVVGSVKSVEHAVLVGPVGMKCRRVRDRVDLYDIYCLGEGGGGP